MTELLTFAALFFLFFFFILSYADLHLRVTVAYCWKSTTEALILKTSLMFSPLSPPNVIKFSVLQALCLLFKIFHKLFFFPLPLTPSKHMWSKPDKPGLPACGDDSRTPHTPPALLTSHPPGFVWAFSHRHSCVCLFAHKLILSHHSRTTSQIWTRRHCISDKSSN